MFSRQAVLVWPTEAQLGRRDPSLGLTRREVIAGQLAIGAALAPGVSWAAVADGAEANGDVRIVLDGQTWVLRADAFGLSRLPPPNFSPGAWSYWIKGARWPGTVIAFDLNLRFEQVAGRWQMTVGGLGGASGAIPFAAYVKGEAAAAWPVSAADAAKYAAAVGWRALPTTSVTLGLQPDLSWRLKTNATLPEPSGFLGTSALVIRAETGDGGPLDGVLRRPGARSTSARAAEIRRGRNRRVRCGATLDGRDVELKPRRLSEAVTQAWVDGRTALGLVGVWRLEVAGTARAPGGAFANVTGLVAFGRDRDGSHVVVSLPLDADPRQVPLDGGVATLRGGRDEHRIIVEGRDGRITNCSVRGLITNLALQVEGADYSQLQFDAEDALLLFHGGTSLTEALGFGYSLSVFGRWRVPLDKARLRLARADDLLSLTYRFKDVALVRRWGSWRLDLAPGGSDPVMLVEFPPQHVLERAFFRQLDTIGVGGVKAAVPIDRDKARTPAGVPMTDDEFKIEQAERDPDFETPTDDPFEEVIEARLSNPSQVAFALPVADGGGRLERRLRLSLEDLTDWQDLTPVVVPRARSILRQAGDAKPKLFSRAAPTPLVTETDPAAILRAHSIGQAGTLAQRWRDVLDDVRPPRRFETAIELPARLVLSPSQTGRFSSSSLLRDGGPIPLWNARLDIGGSDGRGDVRAVWSPDFNKIAFEAPGDDAAKLERGPFVPWCEGADSRRKLRLPLSAADRHELVALSTLVGLPTLPRLPMKPASDADSQGVPLDEKQPDNVVAPKGWVLPGFQEQGVYLPPTMKVRELTLSSLGGSLDIAGRFEPPAGPYPLQGKAPLWPALTLETWNQSTVLGRDVFVEVIYKGFLFPIGHRASLVKRTERYFYPGPDGYPSAYLIQSYFIRINHPERTYPRIGHPFDGRDFPIAAARFKTTRTPDIKDPHEDGAPDSLGIEPNGAVRLNGKGVTFWPRVRASLGGEVRFEVEADGAGYFTVPLVFADNTAAHDPERMEELVAWYEGLDPAKGLTIATFNGEMRRYAPERRPRGNSFETARWILGARGRGDRPEAPFQMDAAMEGADQPPFYPRVREGHVLLKTLQQFSGRTGDHAVVSFDDVYVRHGLSTYANPAQIYLAVHGYLPTTPGQWYTQTRLEPVRLAMEGQGDRSGGIAQPNVWAVNFSASLGPVGGQSALPRPNSAGAALAAGAPAGGGSRTTVTSAASARRGLLSGVDFFPFDATLFGLLSLRELVKTAMIGAGPKLLAEASAAVERAEQQLQALLDQLRPKLQEALGRLDQGLRLLSEGMDRVVAGYTGRQLYPRVAAALDHCRESASLLTEKVRTETGDPVERVKAVVQEIQHFNDAVSDLVAELDRVANDPMPQELKDFLGQAMAVAEALRKSDPNDMVLAPLKGLSDQVLGEFCSRHMATWNQTVLGPALEEVCTKPETITNLPAFLERAAETAGEAIAYEAVGRPILRLVTSVADVEKKLKQAAAKDLRILMSVSLDVTGQLIEAAQAASQGVLLHYAPTYADSCQQGVKFIRGVVLDGAAALSSPIDALERLVAKVETGTGGVDRGLAGLSDVEARSAAALAKASRLREEARAIGLGKPELTAALAQVERGFGGVVAAREGLTRFRTGAGAAIDRLKDMLLTMRRQQAEFYQLADGAICPSPVEIKSLLEAAGRWMNLRLRAVADVQAIFSRSGEAFGVQLPPAQLRAAETGSSSDERKILENAIQLAKLAADIVGETTTLAAPLLKRSGALLAELSSLRDASVRLELQKLAKQFAVVLRKAEGNAAAAHLETRADEIVAIGQTLSNDLATALNSIRATASPEEFRKALEQILAAVGDVGAFTREHERALVGFIAAPIAAAEKPAQDAIVLAASKALNAVVEPLAGLHVGVVRAWDRLFAFLAQAEVDPDLIKLVLQASLEDLLVKGPEANNGLYWRLVADRNDLIAIKGLTASGAPEDLRKALNRLDVWRQRIETLRADPNDRRGVPATAVLARDLAQVVDALTSGRLAELVDVSAVRAEIQAAILDLVLPKLTVSYGFQTQVNPLRPFFEMMNEGERAAHGGDTSAPDLKLDFELTVDLRGGGKRQLTSRGVMQPFIVDVFEVVKLYFRPAEFTSEDGRSPDVNIKVSTAKLGAAVSFVEALSAFLSPAAGSGFYIHFNLAPPGVEAGFAIDLGTISIGTVSFSNIAFGASVELPFDNRPALFKFNFARRDLPFLIFATPFGGGGFLSLISDARSIVGFEASFEYGGGGAFQAGPLTGQGRIMTGLYISRAGESVSLAGFFVAAGSARIACFGISACLLVSIQQVDGGDVIGLAKYSFSFSLGLSDITYEVEVRRTIGKGWSGGGGGQKQPAGLTREAHPAPASVDGGRFTSPNEQPDPPPLVRAGTVAMNTNWAAYQRYFDEAL